MLFLSQPTLSPRRKTSPRIIVLFDVDTLRRDHVSAYGYRRKTTPNIDAFFADGLIAERCVSNSEWTLPSHATLFTSTLPNRHGVGDRNYALPDGLPTLAELLAEAGYRTIGVTNGGYVDSAFGFARGFDVYDATEHNAEDQVSRALELLDAYAGEPIFLFFHTYQVHDYSASRKAAEALFGSVDPLGPCWDAKMQDFFSRDDSPERLQTWLINRYDAALRTVDDAFRLLTSGLEKRGLLSSTGWVVTSDHGEEILDRPWQFSRTLGYVGHTHPFLYEEYLAVPLLMKLPWLHASSQRIDADVSLLDLAPTLLEAVHVARPQSFEGLSFLAPSSPGRKEERIIVSDASRYDALALRQGPHKMILRPGYPIHSWEDGSPFGILPTEECFDLAADAGEEKPLVCESLAWARDLRVRAEGYVRDEFPGSLVFRFPPDKTQNGVTYALRARGRTQAPTMLSFGLDPQDKFWVDGDAVAGKFRVGAAPVWIAFRPEKPAAALQVEVFGSSGVRIPRRAGTVQGEALGWTELLCGAAEEIEDRVSACSTRPGALLSAAEAPGGLPDGLVSRLRSLGYISGGWTMPVAVRESTATGTASFPSLSLGEGRVRLEVQASVPDWKPPTPTPPPRLISHLYPDEARVGEAFQQQVDGSSAISVEGDGFVPEDRVFWNGQELPTTFGGARWLTAVVPARLLTQPGKVEVSVRAPLQTSSKPVEHAFRLLPREAKTN